MSRLMSVAFTEQAVLERRKRVTRRKGWWLDKNGRRLLHPGDTVTLCRKVMGRKPGEPLVRLVDVEITSIRREALGDIASCGDPLGQAELELEGFTDLTAAEFVERYFKPQGLGFSDEVTRIEWRYLDEGGE